MATLWTNKYTIYNTTYGWMYGYASYSTSESNTAVTVSCSALGEASTEGPGTYTETASASLSLTFGGNTVASGSFSSSRSRRCDEGVYKYYPTGGSGSKSISKGTTATTATLKLTYTIRGTSYTGSVNINIPALTKHTVSYNANGGSGAPSAQTKYYGQNITLSSTKPTRTGYTFMGWGSSSSDTSVDYAAGATYSVNQTTNVTLYAIWKKDIILSYDANEGEGAPASQSATIYNNAANPTFTISSTKPTRVNYDFLGWATSATATTAEYQPNGTITLGNSSTLHAVWKLAYIASQISDIVAYRCDANGTDDGEGTYGRLTFKLGQYSNGSELFWPDVSATCDGSITINLGTPTTDNNTRTYTSNVFELSGEGQHDIAIIVTDGSYGGSTASTFISAKFFTIDITPDGKTISFLAAAPSTQGVFAPPMTESELNAFLDSLNRNFRGSVDWIVEEGTDGIWTYRKWDSGIAECWCSTSTSALTWTSYMASPSANPYLYYSSGWNFDLPFTLIDSSYVINATCLVIGPNFGWIARGSKTTSSFILYIVRNGNSGSCSVDINVKGRWK